MKAVVHDRYGPPEVLRIEDVEDPVPAEDEVLVRVHATTVTRTDVGLRSADLIFSRLVTGIRRPTNRILGMEFAGVVEGTGSAVTGFKAGDAVFGVSGAGAHAELMTIRESAAIAHLPAGLGFDEAAPLADGAALALACFRAANLLKGQSVLIYGAAGAVGSAGVQLAKHLGTKVTAVCSTKDVDLVRSLGADEVIDRTREDFTTRGVRYDVIFDAVGLLSFRRTRRALKPYGTFVDTDLGSLASVPILALVTRWTGGQRVKMGITKYSKEDTLLLKELVEAGTFRAVIDRRYPLEEVVEATHYVEDGHKTGNVVLTVADPTATGSD
jgi:NADPH:quinone reductase-like Zn-dependent oxidoreductase